MRTLSRPGLRSALLQAFVAALASLAVKGLEELVARRLLPKLEQKVPRRFWAALQVRLKTSPFLAAPAAFVAKDIAFPCGPRCLRG